jgi:glycine/D-amino acid oxidase-like deaminating enzyme
MDRQTDILIIGQGICGTVLSLELEQAGVAHLLIDEQRPDTASRAAAGLINPVTGRRIVRTWLIDELLPVAEAAYRQIGHLLGQPFMTQAKVVDFFPTPQMRIAFLQRYAEEPEFLQLPADEHRWEAFFRYDLGFGIISPCQLVDLPGLLRAARQRMIRDGRLLEERFEAADLEIGHGVRYRGISAQKLIFCDGVAGFESAYFSKLPFAPNKGEALIVDIPELRAAGGVTDTAGGADPAGGAADTAGGATVFKKGISLAPWQNGLFWVGSSYEWSFEDSAPTEAFRKRTERLLGEWLQCPFRTVAHIASVRPATLERRPFVGFHPLYPAVGILNGMGTKGCSLAPYFARQLVQHITEGTALRPDADVRRFSKVLSRG